MTDASGRVCRPNEVSQSGKSEYRGWGMTLRRSSLPRTFIAGRRYIQRGGRLSDAQFSGGSRGLEPGNITCTATYFDDQVREGADATPIDRTTPGL